MIEKAIVSVVMITYGHERYISDAIKGVLKQKASFPVELIIADDCSPDNTEGVVRTFANYPNFNWVKYTKHKVNKGMIPNFVWAIKQANGKYIALCEGDDYWTDPYKLQKQINFLDANPEYAGCATNATKIFGTWDNEKNIPYKENITKEDFTLKDLIGERHFHTATFVFRNFRFDHNIFQNITAGDRLLYIMVSLKGKIKLMKDFTSVYRINEGGISSNVSSTLLKKDLKIAHYLKGKLSKEDYLKAKDFILKIIFDYSTKIKLLDYLYYGFLYVINGLLTSKKGLRWKWIVIKKRLLFLITHKQKIYK